MLLYVYICCFKTQLHLSVIAIIYSYSYLDRGIVINEDVDPLTAHLINLDGPRWQKLRTNLTSAFTISKTRNVFKLITEVSEQFKVSHMLFLIHSFLLAKHF